MKSPLHERPLIIENHSVAHPLRSFISNVGHEDMPDLAKPSATDPNADGWPLVPSKFRTSCEVLPAPWEDWFGPLRQGSVDDLMVVGQIGQSIDGRIATVTGHSKYINGPAGLDHLHRLRALLDAVLVGIGTAVADDPLLTVRRCIGPSPARIVLDPKGRIPPKSKVLVDDGIRRIVITAQGVRPQLADGVEIVEAPAPGAEVAPSSILEALRARGFHRILIEGRAHSPLPLTAARC